MNPSLGRRAVNNFVSFYTRHDPQIQAATFDQLNAEVGQIRRSI